MSSIEAFRIDAAPEVQRRISERVAGLCSAIDAVLRGKTSPEDESFRALRVINGVYQQRDGRYLARVRVPGGVLTFEQARGLAAAAGSAGAGTLHVTTRQDIQIHDLPLANVPGLLRDLLEVGLAAYGGGGNGVRNITTCPLAGVCPAQACSVLPLVHRMTSFFLGRDEAWSLPRKFKIVLSGCPHDCNHVQTADVGFLPIRRETDRAPGFRFWAGGGLGFRSRPAVLILPWIPGREILKAAEAVRRVFARYGDRTNRKRARLRFVLERFGEEAFRRLVLDEFDAVRQESSTPDLPDVPFSDIWNPGEPPPPDPLGVPEDRGVLRTYREVNPDTRTVEWLPPLGLLTHRHLAGLLETAAMYTKQRLLRTTCEQTLMIHNVPAGHVGRLAEDTETVFPELRSTGILANFRACAGADTCRLGFCRSREAARACARALEEAGFTRNDLGPFRIAISGCMNACSRHPAAAVGMHGTARKTLDGRLIPAYVVVSGATFASDAAGLAERIGVVPARRLPAMVVDWMREAAATARDRGASLPEVLDAPETRARLVAVVARHATFSPRDVSELDRDLGCHSPFDIPRKTSSECAAELSGLVAGHLSNARTILARRNGDAQAALRAAVRAVHLLHGRATLSGRGLLDELRDLAADAAMLPRPVRERLAAAAAGSAPLNEETLRDLAHLLISAVSAETGESAGGSVGVPAESAGTVSASADAERDVRTLDLRGVPCPLNYARAKVAMAGLENGEKIVMLLDDGDPAHRVVRSLETEGHVIEDSRVAGPGSRLIRVRRAAG